MTESIEKTSMGQAGDPRFLAGVQWCIERRCKIIGIDAPTKSELTGAGGKPLTVEYINDWRHQATDAARGPEGNTK